MALVKGRCMKDLTCIFDQLRAEAKDYFKFGVKYISVVKMRAVYGNGSGWKFTETPTWFTIEADTWYLSIGMNGGRTDWIVQSRGVPEHVITAFDSLMKHGNAWNDTERGPYRAFIKDLDAWHHQQPQTRKAYPEGSSRTTRPKLSPDQTVVTDDSTSILTQGKVPTFGTSQFASKSPRRKTKR